MGIYSTVIALILGIFIITFEFIRSKQGKIDILTGINLIYLLCFSVVPIVIHFAINDFMISRADNLEDSSYFVGSVYSFIAYLVIIGSYQLIKKTYKVKPINNYINIDKYKRKVIFLTIFVSLFGVFTTILYTYLLGGVANVLETGTLYRSGTIEGSQYAFIRNLAIFVFPGSFLFFGLAKIERNKLIKTMYILFFILLFLISLYLLFNRAGRLSLVSYLLIFPISFAVYKNRISLKIIIITLITSLFFILYGKRIFNFFLLDDFSLNREVEIFNTLITEFAFPYLNIASAVDRGLYEELPRYFVDIPIGVLNLLPSQLLNLPSLKTITQYNSEFLGGPIPVDIVTFGYYSFGLAGIVIIAFIFGALVYFTEVFFRNNMNFIMVIFYVAWIDFFAFRIMYTDLTNVLKSNIYLIVSTILLVLIIKIRKNKMGTIPKSLSDKVS